MGSVISLGLAEEACLAKLGSSEILLFLPPWDYKHTAYAYMPVCLFVCFVVIFVVFFRVAVVVVVMRSRVA